MGSNLYDLANSQSGTQPRLIMRKWKASAIHSIKAEVIEADQGTVEIVLSVMFQAVCQYHLLCEVRPDGQIIPVG